MAYSFRTEIQPTLSQWSQNISHLPLEQAFLSSLLYERLNKEEEQLPLLCSLRTKEPENHFINYYILARFTKSDYAQLPLDIYKEIRSVLDQQYSQTPQLHIAALEQRNAEELLLLQQDGHHIDDIYEGLLYVYSQQENGKI